MVFASGFLLGVIEGGIVGALSMGIYTLVNPYGPPPLPVGVAQVLSMVFIGICGGLSFYLIYKKGMSPVTFVWTGTAGVLLTLFYDILTNLGVVIVAGEFVPVMLAGVPFALIHLLSNAIIFVLLTPVLFRLAKLERRGEFA